MNILHHKSWHVRTKANIERVRRDEAQAAEEEKEKQRRIAIAESEDRTERLRVHARKRRRESDEEDDNTQQLVQAPQGHINFFTDEEQGKNTSGTNAEYEAEKRAEKEKQEKAIGLLTYLGQSAVESQNEKPWYFKPPTKRQKTEDTTNSATFKEEFDLKHKWNQDPMKQMVKLLHQRDKVIERDKAGTSVTKSVHTEKKPPSHMAGELGLSKPSDKTHSLGHVSVDGTRSDITNQMKSQRKEYRKKQKRDKHKHKKQKSKCKHGHREKHKHKKRKHKHRSPSPVHTKSQTENPNSSSVVPSNQTSCSKSIQELRAERLQRERQERMRAEELLAKLHGDVKADSEQKQPTDEREIRYNSQFNPEFVRQKKRRDKFDLDSL